MKIKKRKVDIQELRPLLLRMHSSATTIKDFSEYNKEETNIQIIKENNNDILIAANNLLEELNNLTDQIDNETATKKEIAADYFDPKYEAVRSYVLETGETRVSKIQREFRICYARALKIISLLKENEIIGSQNSSIPEEIIVSKDRRN